MQELDRLQKSAFVSYSKQDKPAVRRLCKALEQVEIRTWIDDRAITVGEPIPTELAKGIRGSDYFVFCMTPRSVKSPWCLQELDLALMLEKEGYIQTIPVLLENCEMPLQIREHKYADFVAGRAGGFLQLVALMCPCLSDSPVAKGLAEMLEE
jgi:hypothetical protein